MAGIRIIPIDLAEEERIRNETWIRAAGGKSTKGNIRIIFHESSSPPSDSQDFIELKQKFKLIRSQMKD